jgi:hypothetical protein
VSDAEIVPVDTGIALVDVIVPAVVTPLEVVYPTTAIRYDSDESVKISTLDSVDTVGGVQDATYCSRIASENITRLLTAGVWDAEEIAVVRGDAKLIIQKGISDKTLTPVAMADMAGYITDKGDTVYDIYEKQTNQV